MEKAIKIGILQTGLVPDDIAANHGQYPDMFGKFLGGHGFEFETYAVVENVFPGAVNTCDGWLITGSKYASYDDHPWIPPLEDFIQNAYAAEIPLAGICFGHQIMARALGGSVEKFGGIWGVGNCEYTRPDGSRFTLLAMHQDQVIDVPSDATVTATSDYCKNAALVYKGKAMSIQAHPEFTPPFIKELIDLRIGTVIPEDQAKPALESLFQDNDSARIAEEIAEFFKQSLA